jgi:hypothetical protein
MQNMDTMPINNTFSILKNLIVILLLLFAVVDFSAAQGVCATDGEGMPMDPPLPGAFDIDTPPANERTSTFVDLTWDESANATVYEVQYRAHGATTPWITELTITNGSESARVDDLTPNTLYEFRIVAVRICSWCTPTCVQRSSSRTDVINNIRTAPDKPNVGTPTVAQVHPAKFTAVWVDEPGANSYRLDVSLNNSFTSFVSGYNNLLINDDDATSHVVDELTPGETYYYRVRAINSFGSASPNSTTKAITTLPSVVSLSTPTEIGQGTFKAVWNSVNDDNPDTQIRYQLVVDDNSNMLTPLATISPITATNEVVNTTDIPTLTAGTRYYYRVQATNNNNFGNAPYQASSAIVDLLPATPILRDPIDIKEDAFTARWDAVTISGGTLAYQLIVDDNADMSSPLYQVNVGNITSKTITRAEIASLSPATVYYCKVKATNNGVFTSAGLQAEPRAILTLPAPTTLIAPTDIGQLSWRANWNAVTSPGTLSYRLQIDNSEDFSSLLYDAVVGDVTQKLITSSEIPGLQNGHRYYYRVRVTNNDDFTFARPQAVAATIDLLPATPELSASTNLYTDRFTANWQAVGTEGGTLAYQLLIDDQADFSSPLYAANVGNSLSKTITSAEIPELLPATIYYVKVRSTNNNSFENSGFPSDPVSALTLPVAPALIPASEIGPQSFKAKWEPTISPGTISCKLEVDDSEDFLTLLYEEEVGNVVEKTIGITEIPSLQSGTQYFYRVRVTNNGDFSNSQVPATQVAVLTTPSVPELSSTAEQNSISLSWEASHGATQYRLELATDENFEHKVAGYEDRIVTSTTVHVAGLISGIVYYARIRSENASGVSAYSGIRVQVTLAMAPQSLTVSGVRPSLFNLTWDAVTGVTRYRLDVATDINFNSLLEGYSGLTLTENQIQISSLHSGTPYFIRVRSENDAGNSPYAQAFVITLPDAPVPQTEATQTEIDVTWNLLTGATQYRIEVAEDQDFVNVVPGYDDKVVNGNSITVVGLAPGTSYYIRMRAENTTGLSDYSLVTGQITIALPPVQITAHTISGNVFTASWENVNGADHYKLDVSTDPAFANILTNYNDIIVNGNSQLIASLYTGTNYYVKVRSVNSGGTSGDSDVLALITLAAKPSNLATSNITSGGFIAAWEQVTGAAYYEIQVSRNNTFTSVIADYNPKKIVNALEEGIIGLLPNEVYHWRVRSGNASGVSDYSLIKVVPTLASDGTNRFIVSIGNVTFPPEYNQSEETVRVNANARLFPVRSEFYHKKITETEYEREVIITEAGDQSIDEVWDIQDAWLDELGMEFYIVVTDAADQTSQSTKRRIARSVSAWNIPVRQYGNTVREYQMISNPYVVENNIEEMLEPIMGSYDPARWRLVRYQSGKNVDYAEGLSKTRMERGNGYWFLSRNEMSLSFGPAGTPENTDDNPHVMQLVQGWNQVGNPFPFDISWTQILEHNDNPATVSGLKTYDGAIEGFRESDVLPVFEGGFVYADAAVTLTVPVSVRNSSEGRMGAGSIDANNVDGDSWTIPLTLSQGRMVNLLGGFGMHPEASDSKDRYDEVTLPRFVQYLEFNSMHRQTNHVNLSRDIVSPGDEYTWNFTLEHNVQGDVTIQWPSERISSATSMMLLHDLDRNSLIDMKQDSMYQARAESKNFRIYYNRNVDQWKGDIQLGTAYPNPASHQITIPYGFTNSNTTADQLNMIITDVAGRKMLDKRVSIDGKAGLRSVMWDCTDAGGRKLPSGTYIITLQVEGTASQPYSIVRNRIVIE